MALNLDGIYPDPILKTPQNLSEVYVSINLSPVINEIFINTGFNAEFFWTDF